LLTLLAFAAGYIDAISYLALDRVFVANMTGNTVLLGIAFAQLDAAAAARSSTALAGFLAGVICGAAIVERDGTGTVWPPAVTLALTLECVFLVVFGTSWHLISRTLPAITTALILLSSLAMGVQSAAIRRLGVSGIATTYITGTLTHLMAQSMRSRSAARGAPSPRAVLLSAVCVTYFGGAAVAALILRLNTWLALLLPAGVIAAVVLTAVIAFPRR
jgi:uncharacterized membrane protein YoaK (UPF0700 family)